MKYTAILLAGSRPGRDPFAEQFGTDMKALIAVCGEPMVRRPIRALLQSEKVGSVIVLGQSVERIADVVPSDARLMFRRSEGTIAETMLGFCNDPETPWPLLVTTADHALLDSGIVAEFLTRAKGADLAVGIVESGILMKRFPNSKRTWLKFRGGAFTGANLFAIDSPKAAPVIELWRSVEQDRKKGWRLISLLGPLTLAATALRLFSIDQVLGRLGRKLGLRLKAVRLSNPMAGVDVDKPCDLSLVEAVLQGRA